MNNLLISENKNRSFNKVSILKKIISCTFVLLLLTGNACAKPGEVIISGTSTTPLDVEVIQYPVYFITPNREYQRYHAKVTGTVFNLHIPGIKNPTYLFIKLASRDTVYNLAYYLVEGGDSVHIDTRKDSLVFSGKAGPSFTCQYLVNRSPSNLKGEGDLMKQPDMYIFLSKKWPAVDSLYATKQKIIDKYRDLLSVSAYTILSNDWCGQKESKRALGIDFYMAIFSNDPARQQQVTRFYQDHFANQAIDTAKAALLVYSRGFLDYLVAKTKLDVMMQGEYRDKWTKPMRTAAVYAVLQKKYTGILKERALTQFVATQPLFEDSNYRYLQDLSAEIREPFLHSIIIEVQRKSNGVPAYSFNLPDSTGKMNRLSDFKGKVVVIDFWYTGCNFCESLAKKIKPTIDSLKGDPRFAFLTVSIDRDIKGWKKSLLEGRYTSDGEINLYTNGQGGEHDFIQYYRIHTYPQLIIIDTKGRIFSVNPQRNETGKFQLKPVIEKALIQ